MLHLRIELEHSIQVITGENRKFEENTDVNGQEKKYQANINFSNEIVNY